MKTLIDINYPGTKLSISEWASTADNDITGGLLTVDSLGIFGQYGVDAATYWATPGEQAPVGLAYWLYRGYVELSHPMFSLAYLRNLDTVPTSETTPPKSTWLTPTLIHGVSMLELTAESSHSSSSTRSPIKLFPLISPMSQLVSTSFAISVALLVLPSGR
jgi:hypothetical protein